MDVLSMYVHPCLYLFFVAFTQFDDALFPDCLRSLSLCSIPVETVWRLCLLFRLALCWWQQRAVKWSIFLSPPCVNWCSVNWYLAPPFSMAAWMSVLLIARPPPLSPRLTLTSPNWLMNSRMRWRTLMMRPLWMIPAPTLELRRDQTSSMMGTTRFTTDPLGSF